MGLYNFQQRFVPFILRGAKTHTIRAMRKHPDRPGNILHLYAGLRTKKAKLLMRVECVKVEDIDILESMAGTSDPMYTMVRINGCDLGADEKAQLAWRDGFHDFEDMMNFWDGRLPFRGHIIHWHYEKTKTQGSERL
jgi:hypothetical protein